ncbi:RNA polymerase sporulation sigma factor SigE [Caldicellulosiruptoraceae bacterium PP1]
MKKEKGLINLILKLLKKFQINLSLDEIEQIFYVGGTDFLPPPLSAEEELEVLNKIHNEKNEELKRILIERNLRLVVYIARKFENTKINLEDLVSIGTIGLIKAINTYNLEKNIKLATYASKCIENEILMFLRRNMHNKVELSIDEPLNVDWDGNELLLSDVLGTDVEVVYRKIEYEVEKETLKKAIDKLPIREKKIVELRFGFGQEGEKTQKEVADILGISQSYISRLEKKILNRLKKELAKII